MDPRRSGVFDLRRLFDAPPGVKPATRRTRRSRCPDLAPNAAWFCHGTSCKVIGGCLHPRRGTRRPYGQCDDHTPSLVPHHRPVSRTRTTVARSAVARAFVAIGLFYRGGAMCVVSWSGLRVATSLGALALNPQCFVAAEGVAGLVWLRRRDLHP